MHAERESMRANLPGFRCKIVNRVHIAELSRGRSEDID